MVFHQLAIHGSQVPHFQSSFLCVPAHNFCSITLDIQPQVLGELSHRVSAIMIITARPEQAVHPSPRLTLLSPVAIHSCLQMLHFHKSFLQFWQQLNYHLLDIQSQVWVSHSHAISAI